MKTLAEGMTAAISRLDASARKAHLRLFGRGRLMKPSSPAEAVARASPDFPLYLLARRQLASFRYATGPERRC